MKKLLVLQHVAHELLGTLNPLLKRAGFRIRYVNFARHPDAEPSLDGYDGLIVLGGPMSVNDANRLSHLMTELKLIEEAMRRDIPVLGICLGAQLIAKALGAPVRANGGKEIGWADVSPTPAAKDDPLFWDFGEGEKIFQWHSDTFELPAGAVQLATSQTCLHQAFRYSTNVYGLQFHLEVDEPLIERWLTVPAHCAELDEGRIDPAVIRRETTLYLHRARHLSDQVFGRFIDLFNLPPKRAALRSR